MFRVLKLASFALLGYAVYEFMHGMIEGQEGRSPSAPPPRRPLRSNEPGRGVIAE